MTYSKPQWFTEAPAFAVFRAAFFSGLLLTIAGCATTGSTANSVGVSERDTAPPRYLREERADDAWRVLVVPGDEAMTAVAHSVPMVGRLAGAIGRPIRDAGIAVYQPESLGDVWRRDRRLRRSEIVESAILSADDLEALVVFETFVQTYAEDRAVKANLRVKATLLELPGGRTLGEFEQTQRVGVNPPSICDYACMIDLLGSHLVPLGNAVGRSVTDTLTDTPRSYLIRLRRGETELSPLRREIDNFPARVSSGEFTDNGGYLQYSYVSRLTGGALQTNLERALRRLSLTGRVERIRGGFTVRISD